MDQSLVGSYDETQRETKAVAAPAIAGCWHPVRGEIHQAEDEPAAPMGVRAKMQASPVGQM